MLNWLVCCLVRRALAAYEDVDVDEAIAAFAALIDQEETECP